MFHVDPSQVAVTFPITNRHAVVVEVKDGITQTTTSTGRVSISVRDSDGVTFRNYESTGEFLPHVSRLELGEDRDRNGDPIYSPPGKEPNDAMTADPETDSEDGFVRITISGTAHRILRNQQKAAS
ncbi:hypothetical protein [Halosimplex sp. J119]